MEALINLHLLTPHLSFFVWRNLNYISSVSVIGGLPAIIWLKYCRYVVKPYTIVCLFVWSFSSHSRIFSLIWRRHHCRWRAANFDLCSALMAIEQWGFFSVPHLLWQGVSVYNGGPVTLAPIAERLAVEHPLPVLKT